MNDVSFACGRSIINPLSPLNKKLLSVSAMASVPPSSTSLRPSSGGKTVPTRRALRSITPYDRPNISTSGHEENPNWISRLVLSPTLMIATGAGNLLSSVFRHQSSSSSSSGSDSEEETEDEDNYSHVTSEGFRASKKNQTSEMDSSIKKEVQVGRKATKSLIEQLLMQETFSRDECDRFIEILKARVIVSSNMVEADDERLTETTKKAVDRVRPHLSSTPPHLSSTPVLEARKWINEQKCGSKSKLESHISDDVVNKELHSPVDLAKSYMQARPRWASPFINHLELKSPPSGIQLSNEGTKYSIDESSLPTSKLRKESPASGSWNIKEELRRVRSKATEEMLRNLPSKKIDWSSFVSGNNCTQNSIGMDKQKTCSEEKGQGATRTVDVPLIDSILMPVLDKTHIESVDGDSNGVIIQDHPPANMRIEGKSDQDYCHVPSSSSGQGNHGKLAAKEQNSNLYNHEPGEEPCELESETWVEVRDVNDRVTAAANESDSMASGSHSSRSKQQYQELSQELRKPNRIRITAGRSNEAVDDGAQTGRKLSRGQRKRKGPGPG